jgi:hypothetical protein
MICLKYEFYQYEDRVTILKHCKMMTGDLPGYVSILDQIMTGDLPGYIHALL